MTRQFTLISIGINEYDEFTTLGYANNDSALVASTLSERLGNSLKRLEIPGTPTTRLEHQSVRAALTTLGKCHLKPDDAAMLFFAGHGYTFEGRDYLVCSDTRRADHHTAIPTDEIIAALNSSGAGTSVLVVDACRRNAGRTSDVFGSQTAELARRQGVIVLFGCSPGEICQELPGLGATGQGVFTYALAEVLRAGGPTTPLSLDSAVSRRVAEICLTNKLDRQQPYTAVAPIQKAALDLMSGRFVSFLTGRGRRCLVIAGPSNAGKTVLGQHLATRHEAIHMEMSMFAWKRFQANKTNTSLQDFMEHLWSQQPRDVIAKDLMADLPNVEKFVICGPRTPEELRALRAYDWGCSVVYVYAGTNTRYERYVKSQESGRFRLDYGEFVQKDLREMAWGLAAMGCDRSINLVINEGVLEELFNAVTPYAQAALR